MPSTINKHLILSGIALTIAALIGGQSVLDSVNQKASLLEKQGTAIIAIEHTSPASIRFEISFKENSALLHLINKEADIAISLPEDWQRGEVKGVSLSSIKSDPPAFGFIRWSIPKNIQIQFRIPNTPTKAIVHNPSESSLKVTLATLNLETDEFNQNIFLLKEDPVTLWE